MQLPPDEEVVMVSGHPPIKAAKLRYYQDRNFTRRVWPPPVLALGGYADEPAARADDWTGLALPTISDRSGHADSAGFADEGGHQLKPELEVRLDELALPEVDGLLELDDEDDVPLRPRSLDRDVQRQSQRTARLAALDPDDGIAL